MFRIVTIMIVCAGVIFGAEDPKTTPQCNACYDKILDSVRGVNILKSGKDFYDATLISLGFVYGVCGVKELRGEPIHCNEVESYFELFRYNLVSRAGGNQ